MSSICCATPPASRTRWWARGRTSRSARNWRHTCCARSGWKAWAGWPVASPMTSTTSSRQCSWCRRCSARSLRIRNYEICWTWLKPTPNAAATSSNNCSPLGGAWKANACPCSSAPSSTTCQASSGKPFTRTSSPGAKHHGTLWLVSGDATQLHQVLMNLCVNARDAMPEGGTLTLKLENQEFDESFARMTPGTKPGRYVCLSVTDTGAGHCAGASGQNLRSFFHHQGTGQGNGVGLVHGAGDCAEPRRVHPGP